MHNHGHTSSSQRIGWAFFLNLGFTLIEIVGGLLTNSTAIMADAVHDLGDCISIGLAWLLSKVSEKDSNTDFTYGYRRLSLLGALINGLVLIAGSAWVLSEAIPKLLQPEMPVVEGMLGLAIFGVMVNGFAAYKLSHGKTLNEKVLNWHLLEDVLGWVAVLIVSTLLKTLEEPPGESFILLETERFGSVLPTIRSRCQRVNLGLPSREDSISWLQSQGVSVMDAETALVRNAGGPVAASEWLASGVGAVQEKWVSELLQWTNFSMPLDKVASAWGKLEFQTVIQWFYQWSCDVLKSACGAAPEHLQFADPVTELMSNHVVEQQMLVTFQKKLQQILGQLMSGASHHNKMLTLETLLLEWQALTESRAGVTA